jgi:hypothetical protein
VLQRVLLLALGVAPFVLYGIWLVFPRPLPLRFLPCVEFFIGLFSLTTKMFSDPFPDSFEYLSDPFPDSFEYLP